jgi:hypothetical protein
VKSFSKSSSLDNPSRAPEARGLVRQGSLVRRGTDRLAVLAPQLRRPSWRGLSDRDNRDPPYWTATNPRSPARRSAARNRPNHRAERGDRSNHPAVHHCRPPVCGGEGHQERRRLVVSGPLTEISARRSEIYTGERSLLPVVEYLFTAESTSVDCSMSRWQRKRAHHGSPP